MPKGMVGATTTGRRLLHDARGAMRHLVHAAPVDHAGQVRPVLLGGADRHDDDGVARRQRLDLRGLQPRPFDLAHRALSSDGSGAIGMPSHFWCSRSSSPFIVLKKMKLSSQRTRLMLAHAHAHVGGAAADHELDLELLARIALLQVGDDQAVGGEQLGLAGEVGRGGGGVVLGAHDVGLGRHRRQGQLLGRSLGGGDLQAADVGGRLHVGALGPEHREVGVGIGRGEHDLLGALGREPHHRDHDVDLVGQQEGDAVGAGDLLHLELHAQRLGDHAGQLDVEALGLARLVLRAERRHVERHGDAHHAFLQDVLETVGLGRLSAEGGKAQGQQAHDKALHVGSPFLSPAWILNYYAQGRPQRSGLRSVYERRIRNCLAFARRRVRRDGAARPAACRSRCPRGCRRRWPTRAGCC